MSLVARKPIADLLIEDQNPNALKRVLGAGVADTTSAQ